MGAGKRGNNMPSQEPVINLEWIDEQVRQYRNELIAAQQRISVQEEENRQQARHIEDLEARLVSVNTQLNRITVLERSLDQYKEEIRLLVEQHQEEYQQDRRESARIKLIEQDNTNRTIADLRKGLVPISRIQEDLELHAAEQRRLSDAQLSLRQKVLDMEKEMDTELRAVPYLQEQRARDAKNIAQLQEQVSGLLKSLDTVNNRLPVLEEQAHRNAQRIEELITIRTELQQQQRRFLEEMQLNDQQRQRLVNEWAELEKARDQKMSEFSEQMRLATEQSQKIKSSLVNLESLGERLQREQHETSELQRLSEERQRNNLEEWEAQAERRWQREKLLWEQQWHDHDRREAAQLEQLELVDQRSEDNEEQVVYLWETLNDDIRLRNEASQNHLIKIQEQAQTRRNKKKLRPQRG
jgi:hypothetical protein